MNVYFYLYTSYIETYMSLVHLSFNVDILEAILLKSGTQGVLLLGLLLFNIIMEVMDNAVRHGK
jgi:hypothetical protein